MFIVKINYEFPNPKWIVERFRIIGPFESVNKAMDWLQYCGPKYDNFEGFYRVGSSIVKLETPT